MNEPTEHAQKTTGKITAKDVLRVLKSVPGGSVGLHGNAVHDRESYSDSYVFSLRTSTRSYKTKVEKAAEISVPGWVSTGHTSKRETRKSVEGREYAAYSEAYKPLSGFWYLYSDEALRDVLELLPGDAEVAFFVYLDAGTNELLVNANVSMTYDRYEGMHADHLYLKASYMVRGKRKERTFLISTSTGVHNSARFGYAR